MMKAIYKSLLFTLTISLLSPYSLAALPKASSVPGGIVQIDLGPTHHPTKHYRFAKPTATYKSNPVAVIKEQTRYKAIVGISLFTKTGKHTLFTQAGQYKKNYDFWVHAKEYPKEHITLPPSKNKTYNAPKQSMIERWKQERKQTQKAFKTFTNQPVNIEFIRPVPGRLSSLFGFQRVFNGHPRKPHSGLDFAAPTGTPIKVVADGKVILTGHHFFNGKTVIVDHGQGLITFYCHMNKIKAKKGETVKQGDIIGTVGATGRSTGPHLHLSVSLNNNRVDPALFFDF